MQDTLHRLQRAVSNLTLTKRVKLNFDVAQNVPDVVDSDKRRVEQVLINLIENAVLYSERSSSVDVEVRFSESDLVVSVRNKCKSLITGEGSKLFSKFFRANGNEALNPQGAGLGLFLSK